MTTEPVIVEPSLGYIFDLHLLCGGYAYYSTFSGWTKYGEHNREIRKPREININGLSNYIKSENHPLMLITDRFTYELWLMNRGWGIVPINLARSMMSQWLKSKVCLKSPSGSYTDIEICSKNALNHYASSGKRKAVFERDGHKCLGCGKTAAEGATLTMQHVRPFSRGGETTTRNLVTLCEECNAKWGTVFDESLYRSADILHDIDLGILRGNELTEKNFPIIARLSANFMHTRCEVW